jgi:hypothetical protein
MPTQCPSGMTHLSAWEPKVLPIVHCASHSASGTIPVIVHGRSRSPELTQASLEYEPATFCVPETYFRQIA